MVLNLKWLNNIGIREKLLLFTLIPTVAILLLTASEISDKYHFYKQNKEAYKFLSLVIKLDNLVLEIQRERGISSGLLETRSTLFSEKLGEQRKLTDKAMQEYLHSRDRINVDFLDDTRRKFMLSLDVIPEKISDIRSGVDSPKYLEIQDIENLWVEYTELNEKAIDFIRFLPHFAEGSGMVSVSNAYIILLWLRERAGQERALLIRIFSSGYINTDSFRKIIAVAESQQTLLDNFYHQTPPNYSHLLKQESFQSIDSKVERFRDAARSKMTRNEMLNELLSLIGYGGFIHDFKNYVIRGSEDGLNKTRQLKKKFEHIINNFKTIPGLTELDLYHLRIVENTFARYFRAMENVALLKRQGKSIREIDNHVQVDDTAALKAIHYFRRGIAEVSTPLWWSSSTERIDSIKKASDQLTEEFLHKSLMNIQKAKQSLSTFVFVALMTLLASVLMGVLLVQRIVVALKNISCVLREMVEKKKFDKLLCIEGKDEISVVAAAFNQLMQERHKLEADMKISAGVFTHISEAIIIASAQKQIKTVNPAFVAISGYSRDDVSGKNLLCLGQNSINEAEANAIWVALQEKSSWQGEIWHKKPDGEKYIVLMNISVIRNEMREITQYIAIFSDITQRKQYDEEIWRQAHFDELTKLPNRKMCLETLGENLMIAKRRRKQVAVLFIDLDRFKLINDTWGHKAGDELLVEVASRLKLSVRETDIVSRLGGDEFVIILTGIHENNYITYVSQRVLTSLSKPISLSDGSEVQTSGSIGIALFPEDSSDLETLMKQADFAMYESKKKVEIILFSLMKLISKITRNCS